MASRALDLTVTNHWKNGNGHEMAASDLGRILTAIDGLGKETREALGESREALAALKVELSHVGTALKDLSVKVDRMEDAKAGRSELSIVEARLERSVADVKAGAAFEAGRITKGIEDKFEEAAEGLQAFRESVIEQFKSLRETDVKSLREQVAAHEGWRNRVMGGAAAVGLASGIIGALCMWILRVLFPGKTQ